MVSYMFGIERKSQSLAVFKIHVFAKITFWPFDLGPRSKVMAPSESPYMVSYMYVYNRNEVSICRGFRDICENTILTSWPWAKVKVHGTKWKPMYGFLYVYNRNELSISRCFRYICENSKNDLLTLVKVKGDVTKWKAIHGFLYVGNANGVSNTHRLQNIWEKD